MRFLTDKGQSKYVYGLTDDSIYFNDKSLPQKYRYGNLSFAVENKVVDRSDDKSIDIPKQESEKNIPLDIQKIITPSVVPVDEQKHIIYNVAFLSLNKAKNYDEFKALLKETHVELIEHRNTKGVYGLSFCITNLENSESFKASEISRKLSFGAINSYFETINVPLNSIANNPAIIHEMQNNIHSNYPEYIHSNHSEYIHSDGYKPQMEDDTLLSGKKRKRAKNKNERNK